MALLVFLVTLCLSISTSYASNQVTFWDEPFLNGNSVTLTLSGVECANMPSGWQNRALSKDAVGNARCGYMYEYSDCRGEKVRLERYAWRSLDFSHADFGTRVSSYRNCNPDGKQRIFINDMPDWNGKNWYLDLPTDGSCVTLAPPHDSITSSVILYDYCVIAWDGQFCNGKPTRLDATELGAKDLSYVQMNKKVKSFQLCYGVDAQESDVERTK